MPPRSDRPHVAFEAPRAGAFEPREGTLVAERYRLERLLGRGGMGEVWLARHTSLETPFALKFLDKSLLAEDERDTMLARFRDEARATSALSKRTRHIVAVTDFGDVHGVPFLVMELLDGHSLEDALGQRGALPAGDALAILRQVARGLAVAHEAGLVHRDLKPANIFLCRDEDGQLLVKILDFGLVRPVVARDRRSTDKGTIVGTPLYMSPEQARASEDFDHRADVWSLGVVAYTLLTGTEPWQGETAQDVLVSVCRSEFVPASVARPEVGPRFDAVFERAFDRHVDGRFQHADAFVEAFERACEADGSPLVDAPLDMSHHAAPPLAGPRRRGPIVAAAVVIVALAAIVPVALRRPAHPPSSASAPPASAMASAPAPLGTAPRAPLVAGDVAKPADPSRATSTIAPPTLHAPAASVQAKPEAASPSAPREVGKASVDKPPPPPPKPHDKSAVF